MRILLIRHAEPDYSIDSLTPKGWREAELLSQRLIKYDIKDFYVSPLGRARDTASCTLKKLGREAEVLPWLREFRGCYPDPETGKRRLSWDLMPKVWSGDPAASDAREWVNHPLYAGGNVKEIWEEAIQGADELMARYTFRKEDGVWRCEKNTPDTIALFCHFGISMVMLGYLIDVSPMQLLHRFFTHPSSVTELITEERIPGEVVFRVSKLGDLTHLESVGEPRSNAGLFPECYTGVDSTDPAVNKSGAPKNP